MIRANISRFKDKAKAALGIKKKSALQAPAMTKRVLRWAIRRRSRTLYLVFLSWPSIFAVLVAIAIAVFVPRRPDVSAWLTGANAWMAALLAGTKAADNMLDADRAWKRRGR